MKETNDGPFGLTRIVTDGGTTFFRNSNGIFDESGKKVMISMAELRRFEQNENGDSLRNCGKWEVRKGHDVLINGNFDISRFIKGSNANGEQADC